MSDAYIPLTHGYIAHINDYFPIHRLFNKQPTSNAICCLFYSPSSSILSAENCSATWILAKKWPRMYQILHFPIFFQGRALTSPLPMEKDHYCVSVTTTTPQTALHHHHYPPCIHTSLQQCCGKWSWKGHHLYGSLLVSWQEKDAYHSLSSIWHHI